MGNLFINVVEMSIAASILILAVILIRIPLKKAPKWIMGVLWAIVAFRLIFPFQIESKIGFLPNVGSKIESLFYVSAGTDSETEVTYHYYEPNTEDETTYLFESHDYAPSDEESIVTDYLPNEEIIVTPDTRVTSDSGLWRRDFFVRLQMIWLFGILVILTYVLFSYITIRKKTKASIKLDGENNVFVCDEIDTPFIFGIFKPVIYLPSGLEDETIRNVLAHEKAHIKRLDYLRKQFGFLLLDIHWFNPLVWVAYALFCKDIELACDEKVISHMTMDEKKSYANSLLLCSTHKRFVLAYPLAFGEIAVRTRILNVFRYKKPALWVMAIGMISCVIIGILGMTCRVSADSTEAAFVESIETVEENDAIAETDSVFVNDTGLNHYYNISTKVLNGKTYIETPDGIFVTDNNGSEFKLVTDGMYSLGAAGKMGLYLCEYVTKEDGYQYNLAYLNPEDNSIITLAEDINLSNINGVSHYGGMYIEGKHLYIEGASSFTSFFLRTDTEIEYEGTDNHLVHYDFPYSAVYSAGLVSAFMENRDENLVGDLKVETSDGSYTVIESVRDVMLTSHGALARKGENNNIYLIDYASGAEKLIFNSESNAGMRVGYNTYDDKGFYGLAFVSENDYAVIYCSWDGEYKELYRFHSDETVFGERMNMSKVDDWLYFFDYSDDLMKRINTDNYGIVVIK